MNFKIWGKNLLKKRLKKKKKAKQSKAKQSKAKQRKEKKKKRKEKKRKEKKRKRKRKEIRIGIEKKITCFFKQNLDKICVSNNDRTKTTQFYKRR